MKTRRKRRAHALAQWLKHHHGLVLSLLLLLVIGLASHVLKERGMVVAPPAKPAVQDEIQTLPSTVPEKEGVVREKRPRISIIIDDMGLDKRNSRRAIALAYPLTLSFLPYAENVQAEVNAARARGHQIFLHLPMLALGHEYAGPHALRPDMSDEELRIALEENLKAFEGYEGINNHMGSRFTADEKAMRRFLKIIKEKGHPFLDSRTSALTTFDALCVEMNMPCLRRHVFLDHIDTRESILAKIDELVRLANKKGYAIAIAHPYQNTLAILEEMLPTLATRFDLVPVKP